MLGLYKRGRMYYVQGTHNGQKISRTALNTTSKDVAQARIHQLEKQLDNPHTRSNWQELTELFFSISSSLKPNTVKKYRFVAQRFAAFLERHAITTLGAITPAVIAEYTADRITDTHPTNGASIGSEGMKSDLRCLRRFFNFAIEQDYLKTNPIRNKNINSGISQAQPFSAEETRCMIEHARSPERDRRGAPIDLLPILLTFLRTGLRISDVIEFPKTALNLDSNQIIIETRKRLKTVYIPLTADLKAALLEHLARLSPEQQACPLVFSTSAGRPITSLDAYLRRFWKQAGIHGAHPHRFRDTFAVELLTHGASLYDVAKILGITHTVAERHYTPYVKSLQDRARGIMESLPNLNKPRDILQI